MIKELLILLNDVEQGKIQLNWTFIALVLFIAGFFLIMLILMFSGFHTLESGYTYNGGL